MPAPPSDSGKMTPSSPISPSFFTTSCGNSLFSSHSDTCGAISPSANARTELCNCLCSSVNPNPNPDISPSKLHNHCLYIYHTHAYSGSSEQRPAGRAHYAWRGGSHAFLSCLARQMAVALPWSGSSLPTNGRPTTDRPRKTGTHATKWPRHAQWARPAGHSSLDPIQSLPQIPHNILNILDPNRHPHQPIRNPKPRPTLRPNSRMRHARRMADQRLHPTQRLRQQPKPQRPRQVD